MRFLLLMAVLSGMITGCLWGASESREWSRLEAEDEVFAAVLDSVFASFRSQRLLVREMTSPGLGRDYPPDVLSRRFLERFPDLSEDAVSDFLRINQEPRSIQAIGHHRFRVEIVDESMLRELRVEGSADAQEYWGRVHDRFDGATTIVTYSRPGFNSDRTQAFLVMRYGCGPLCGAAYNVLLTRSAEGWYVAELVMTFVS